MKPSSEGIHFTFNDKPAEDYKESQYAAVLNHIVFKRSNLEKADGMARAHWRRIQAEVRASIIRDQLNIPNVIRGVIANSGDGSSDSSFSGFGLTSGFNETKYLDPADLNKRVQWQALTRATLEHKRKNGGARGFFQDKTSELLSKNFNLPKAGNMRFSYERIRTDGTEDKRTFRIGQGLVIFYRVGGDIAGGGLEWNKQFSKKGVFENSLRDKGAISQKTLLKLINPRGVSRPLLFPIFAFFNQVRYPGLVRRAFLKVK